MLNSPANTTLIERTEEIEILRKIVDTYQGEHPSVVFVHGLPGIGKTTFENQFISTVCEVRNLKNVELELTIEVTNPDRIISHLAHLLARKYGFKFPLLKIVMSYWLQVITQFRPVSEKQELVLSEYDFVLDILEAAQATPVIGMFGRIIMALNKIYGNIKNRNIKSKANSIIRRLENASPQDIYAELTAAFGKDIEFNLSNLPPSKSISSKYDLIIFLDQLEVLKGKNLTFIKDLVNTTSRVLLILKSRDKGMWEKVAKSSGVQTEYIELKTLNKAACTKLLTTHGITDQELQDLVFRVTFGHPHYLCLFLDIFRVIHRQGGTPSVNDFDGLLNLTYSTLGEKMLARLFSDLSSEQRDVLLTLSIPRFFDEEIMLNILTATESVPRLKQELSQYSFVQTSNYLGSGTWKIHELVRGILFEEAKKNKSLFYQQHQKMSSYFASKLGTTQGGMKAAYLCELVYHNIQLHGDADLDSLFFEDTKSRTEGLAVSGASWDDFHKSRKLGQESFGEYADSVPQVIEWYRKNRNILRVLKNDQKDVLGYTLILPMTKEAIQLLIKGELYEHEIQVEHLLSPDEIDQAESLYFAGIAVKKDHRSATYGALLLRDILRQISQLQKHFKIKQIYATIMEPEGDRLANRIGFKTLWEKSPEPGIDVFKFAVLDLSDTENRSPILEAVRKLWN